MSATDAFLGSLLDEIGPATEIHAFTLTPLPGASLHFTVTIAGLTVEGHAALWASQGVQRPRFHWAGPLTPEAVTDWFAPRGFTITPE